jgi:hypothetical protein
MSLTKTMLCACSLICVIPILIFHCKETSTAPEVEPPAQPSITIVCNPGSGGTDTNITINVSINSAPQEIKVFGLEMSFDDDVFQFRSVEEGDLTESWTAVDGNEISNGTLRVGGFMGSGNPISQGNTGIIAKVKFKVAGNSFTDGQQSQICIKSYTDDISGLTPVPSCTDFTLKK